ncbi:hypothetical protein F0562_010525 [Nyssa sinensis]|uniref:Uncharacterized protein n=1 Tax=Nyssa sinensis TaxID=561372 RepID=A0A5J5A1I1_9ASTE|nr:hypothetical protein F0562_010525 [Nyssa sinensis]
MLIEHHNNTRRLESVVALLHDDAASANPGPSAPFAGVALGPSLFVAPIVHASTIHIIVATCALSVVVLALSVAALAPTPLIASDVLALSPNVAPVVLAPNFCDLAIALPQDICVAPG